MPSLKWSGTVKRSLVSVHVGACERADMCTLWLLPTCIPLPMQLHQTYDKDVAVATSEDVYTDNREVSGAITCCILGMCPVPSATTSCRFFVATRCPLRHAPPNRFISWPPFSLTIDRYLFQSLVMHDVSEGSQYTCHDLRRAGWPAGLDHEAARWCAAETTDSDQHDHLLEHRPQCKTYL